MLHRYTPKSFDQINRCYSIIIPDLAAMCAEIKAQDPQAPICFNLHDKSSFLIVPVTQMRAAPFKAYFTGEINGPDPRPVRLDDPRNDNKSVVVGYLTKCPHTECEIFTSENGKITFRNTQLKEVHS